MAIRIVVDSTADYTAMEIEKRNIICVPMTVSFGNESFQDGVNLTKEEFFERLVEGGEFPMTSQPSPADFEKIFEEAKEAGDSVIAILLSSELSGTFQSANIAKNMVEYEDIHIIDSKTATLGIRLLVDCAVHMRDKGKSVQEIVKEIENLRSRVRIYAGLDTLEYLYKGGRLTKAQASLGKLANLKPIITVTEEGKVAMCGKQIGFRRVCRQIVKLVEERKPDTRYPLYYVYSYDKTNCASFVQTLKKQGLDFGEVKTRGIGPTIGTHVGPGAFGIVYIEQV